VTGDRAIVTVELDLHLPAGLRADRLARSPELVECRVRADIALDAASRRVDVTLVLDNQARDHRLRVLCETGTKTLTHVAGAAFTRIERQNRFPIRTKWIEPAIADACVHDLVAVPGATRGLALGVDGLRDYAVLHDGGTIAITLVRAVGFLSRGDLPERRGHAGPELATPSAQCIGERTYRYTVVPLGDAVDVAGAARLVEAWLSPPLPVRGDGKARRSLSLIDDKTPLVLSALRAASDGGLVVRVANPQEARATTAISFGAPVASARPIDLREGEPDLGHTGLDVVRTAAPPAISDNVVTVTLEPYEIGTWLVRLK
jgi:alpha-mannosidase